MKDARKYNKKIHNVWLGAAVLLAAVTIFFYIISYSYTTEYSINTQALKTYATIDTWTALFTVAACAMAAFKSSGWGRIVSVLLFVVCSYMGFSAALMTTLSQATF